MRSLAVLVAAIPACAFAQSDDSRLSTKVTLAHRYLSLAELARTVQTTANIPVSVDKSIADRKATVFCDAVPLGEVMSRVASALWLVWKPEGTGYRLILDPEVAKEERSLLAREVGLAREALQRYLSKAAELAKSTPDELAQEADRLKRRMNELSKDRSIPGREEYQKVSTRYYEISGIESDRGEWDLGYVAAQMTPDHFATLTGGGTIFASTAQRPGTLRLLPDALSKSSLADSLSDKKPTELMLMIRFDPQRMYAEVSRRPLGVGTSAVSVGRGLDLGSDPTLLTEIGKEPLVKRLIEWEKVKEPSVLGVRLDKEAAVPASGPEKVWTLADNLEWLHHKTGVPIVADAFRTFASYDAPVMANTLGDWIEAFNQARYGQATWLPARFRAENGWLYARHRRYWRMIAPEIPERLIVPLEARVAAAKELTFDDYMNFADALTPEQEAGLAGRNLLVRFPTYPLFGNVPMFRLWKALNVSQRTQATQGLPLEAMTPSQQDLYTKALGALLSSRLIDERVLPHYLPGGPPLPSGMALFANLSAELSGPENFRWARPEESMSISYTPYRGARFAFGTALDSPVDYNISIQKLKK